MVVKRSGFFDEEDQHPQAASAPMFKVNIGSSGSRSTLDKDINAITDSLKALKEMSAELKNTEITAALERVKHPWCTNFLAAVFGHDAIGKNAHINRILGKEIFPFSDEEYRKNFGNIPTVIRHGNDGITVRHGKITQKRAAFPLTEEGWKNAAEFAKKNGTPLVEVTVSGTFLFENGCIELFRADLDTDIRGCDCAVELVSAVQPFGESEASALRKINDRVPFIATALIHTESLGNKDRERILDYTKKKLLGIGGDIELLAEGNIDALTRKYIIRCSQSYEFGPRRVECTRREIFSICDSMAEIYTVRLSELEEHGRQTAADAEKQRLAAAEKVKKTWDIIETEMLKKSSERFEWMYNRTADVQNDLLESFRLEVEHTNDPKEWIENVYPYKMKQQMKSLMNVLENNLKNAYMNDTEWLKRQVKTNFGVDTDNGYSAIAEMSAVRSEHMSTSMHDIKKARIGMRAVAGAAAVIGYMTLGPLAPAISIGGGLAAELLLGKKLSEQRKAIINQLNKIIPAELNRRLGEVENNLKELYGGAVSSAREAYEEALEAQASHADGKSAVKDMDEMGKVYRKRIEELKKLKTEDR